MSQHSHALSVISTQRLLAEMMTVWVASQADLTIQSSSVWQEGSAWPAERTCDLRLLVLTPWDSTGEQCLKLAKRQSKLPTLIVSVGHDVLWMQMMLRDHALGYLTTDQGLDDLNMAIGHVMAGDTYVPQRYVKDLMAQAPTRMPHLSHREKLIAKLLVSGESHQSIAEQLHISVKTVSSHKTNIIERLGLRSLPELVRFHDKHPFFFKASGTKTKRRASASD